MSNEFRAKVLDKLYCENKEEYIRKLEKKLSIVMETNIELNSKLKLYKNLLGKKNDDRNVISAKYKKETIKVEERFLFLQKRIVGVYGNKALVDLWNHVDNININDRDIEKMKALKPHF